MDEKEIIKKIKNSFKSGLSRAKITRRLQKKGLKLEYIDLLIKKASKIKKVLLFSSIILILMLVSSMTGYTFFFRQEKSEVVNPLLGNARIMSSGAASQQAPQTNGNRVNINDIEITVDFISFLLNEVGAQNLHRNPLTFEKPIINFNVSNKQFYSVIGNEIKTFEGTSEKADLEFVTIKQEIIRAILNDNPADYFKESVRNGNTHVNTITSQPELFAKGYLSLYDSLKD